MALTAIATLETVDVVKCRLSFDKLTLIALPPHSNNIKYEVTSKIGVDEFTTSLSGELASERTSFPKTVIYVRTYSEKKSSIAILYRGIGRRNATKTVKDFVSNSTVCRRRLLFQGCLMFSESDIHVIGCKCCDVCQKLCTVLCVHNNLCLLRTRRA